MKSPGSLTDSQHLLFVCTGLGTMADKADKLDCEMELCSVEQGEVGAELRRGCLMPAVFDQRCSPRPVQQRASLVHGG